MAEFKYIKLTQQEWDKLDAIRSELSEELSVNMSIKDVVTYMAKRYKENA